MLLPTPEQRNVLGIAGVAASAMVVLGSLVVRWAIWKAEGTDFSTRRFFAISQGNLTGPDNPLLLVWTFDTRRFTDPRLRWLTWAVRGSHVLLLLAFGWLLVSNR